MTYTKINLYLANGIPEALSNLWYGTDCWGNVSYLEIIR